MRQWLWSAALMPALLMGCAQTQQAADTTVAAAKAQVNPTLSTTDAGFMTTATRGGLAEVQLGQLAQRNGRSPAVKRLGERLVADHTRANQELMTLAQQKQITPPDSMGAEHQAVYDRLAALRGRAFDRAFAQAMAQDHREDIQAFQTEARDGTDPDVKAFAARQLPVLQEHMRMAQQLEGARASGARHAHTHR
jgi:putative membrane protein